MSRAADSVTKPLRPAFYATGEGNGGIGDWISLLHLPYTAWHLSYVAIGAVFVGAALEPFTHDWKTLAYGVDIGGLGLMQGSLANLIALRLLGHKGAWRSFHLWSVPALILAAAAGYVLLFAH